MSIDDYTGVKGGGAVNQFFHTLGEEWVLDDHTYDGCRMAGVPTDGQGDVITLTIGGNDLLCCRDKYLSEGLDRFADEHLQLLRAIRSANPKSIFIVGDIYAPHAELSSAEQEGLTAANTIIAANCKTVEARPARIHKMFLGNESAYLCLGIEPTLEGAKAIARLFDSAYKEGLAS
ncbi:MAG: hypothetical protein JXM70_05300 [Pirellulales bacterium]|nr:hypothetical protein [Pirellulales bacterium]